MRNLKKILALALALVMTLSLMTVANAFDDDSQIDETYSEAVTVLSNLGVFKGVEDGSNFAPKQTITRAEVAAIIYRIVTGDVNDRQAGIYADYAAFDDVASNHWAVGYIGYCSNAQLIVGDGTNFYPDQTVTGYQALAMILRAMGYDQNDEFKGEGWEIRVASTAQQKGILRNVSAGTLGTGASREVVAELLFQAIANTNTVFYLTNTMSYQDNDTTLGYQTFGLEQTTGEITAVGRTAGTTTLGNWVTTTGFFGRETTSFEASQVTVTGTDTPWTDIGYQAYVWTVPASGTKTRAAVSDVTVTGESLAVNTAATTSGTIAPLVGTAATAIATLDDDYNVYYNGMRLGNSYANNVNDGYWWDANSMVVRNGSNAVEVVNGLKVDFVDNDDGGLAETIVVTEYTVADVAGIANESNTGSNAIVRDTYYFTVQSKSATSSTASYRTANVVSASTLAVGDLVTYVDYNGDAYVTVAPAATGTFTQINYSATTRVAESYVIGGTTYVLANNDTDPYWQDYFQGDATVLDRTNVGDSLDVYTDPYGYVIKVAESVSATNYLYVIRTDHSSAVAGTTYATVAFADGTISNVYLAYGDSNYLNAYAGEAYVYTVNSAGNYALVRNCTTSDTDTFAHVTGASYTNGYVTLTNGVYFTNSSVVVDVRGYVTGATSATVYTGYSQIPSVSNATFHYVTDANGFVQLAFLTAGTNDADLAKDFVVYHTNAHYYSVDANGDRYYTLEVITGGELTTILLTEEQYTDVCDLGVGIYSYASDGTTLTYEAFTENDAVVTWQDGAIAVGGVGYSYTSDVNFFTLDIARGNAYVFAMNFGNDAVAVVETNSRGVATDIYVIYGDEAAQTTANQAAYTKTAGGNVYTYYQADGYITSHSTTPATTLTWTEQAEALVDVTYDTDGTIDSAEPKDGVTKEDIEDLLADVEEVLDNTADYSYDVVLDAQAAKAILDAALDAIEDGETALESAKDTALDALFEVYDALTTAEGRAAVDTYDAAREAIEAATSEEEVTAALAAGVLAVKAYDEDASDSENLAGALYTAMTAAGQSLNDVVAGLLADDWTVDEIRSGLSSGAAQVHGNVVPALVANDVSVEDIFEGYESASLGSAWVQTITEDLNGIASLTDQDIIEGYVAYALGDDNTLDGWTGMTVSYNAATNTATLTLTTALTPGAGAPTGSGVGDLLTGLGATTLDIEINCVGTPGGTWSYSSYSHAQVKSEIINILGKLNEGAWSMSTEIDGVTYTINFVDGTV